MDMEQRIEQRAKAIARLMTPENIWTNTFEVTREGFRRIARAELEREGRLVHTIKRDIEAFRCSGQPINQERAEHCVARYEAEFAPPKRTVEQIARDIDKARGRLEGHVAHQAVPMPLLDELAAALSAGRE